MGPAASGSASAGLPSAAEAAAAGAAAERLAVHARELTAAAGRLDADAVVLATGIRAGLADWTGAAAGAFHAYAAGTDASRLAASAALRTAAARLSAHAAALAALAAAGP